MKCGSSSCLPSMIGPCTWPEILDEKKKRKDGDIVLLSDQKVKGFTKPGIKAACERLERQGILRIDTKRQRSPSI